MVGQAAKRSYSGRIAELTSAHCFAPSAPAFVRLAHFHRGASASELTSRKRRTGSAKTGGRTYQSPISDPHQRRAHCSRRWAHWAFNTSMTGCSLSTSPCWSLGTELWGWGLTMDLALMAHMRLVAPMLINLAHPRSCDSGGCRKLQRQVRLPALVIAFSLGLVGESRPYSLQPLS